MTDKANPIRMPLNLPSSSGPHGLTHVSHARRRFEGQERARAPNAFTFFVFFYEAISRRFLLIGCHGGRGHFSGCEKRGAVPVMTSGGSVFREALRERERERESSNSDTLISHAILIVNY